MSKASEKEKTRQHIRTTDAWGINNTLACPMCLGVEIWLGGLETLKSTLL
jgi:hypothetical protein